MVASTVAGLCSLENIKVSGTVEGNPQGCMKQTDHGFKGLKTIEKTVISPFKTYSIDQMLKIERSFFFNWLLNVCFLKLSSQDAFFLTESNCLKIFSLDIICGFGASLTPHWHCITHCSFGKSNLFSCKTNTTTMASN